MKKITKIERKFLNSVKSMTGTIGTEIELFLTGDTEDKSDITGNIHISDCSRNIVLSLFSNDPNIDIETTKERNLYKINTIIDTLEKFKTDYLIFFEEYRKYVKEKQS